MKLRSLMESSRTHEIHLEVYVGFGDDDVDAADVFEIPATIHYNWSRPRPATHWEPAEGGVELEGIEIDGKMYRSTQDLAKATYEGMPVNIYTARGDYDVIIDQHIDRLYSAEEDTRY